MKLWKCLLVVRRFSIGLSTSFLQFIGKGPGIATRTVGHLRWWSRRQAYIPPGSASSLCCHWFIVAYLCKFFTCMNIFCWSEYVVWKHPPCFDRVFMENLSLLPSYGTMSPLPTSSVLEPHTSKLWRMTVLQIILKFYKWWTIYLKV
jgi:hypothetical protein